MHKKDNKNRHTWIIKEERSIKFLLKLTLHAKMIRGGLNTDSNILFF